MARARLLKPGFFANEDLACLPHATRLLFAGLWTIADREGRLEDRPARIRAALFPYESLEVDKMLQELDAAGFIVRYAVEGAKFISIPTFLRHQRPHIREAKSEIPAPPVHQPRHSLGSAEASPKLPVLDPVSDPVSETVSVPMSATGDKAARPSLDPELRELNDPMNLDERKRARAARSSRQPWRMMG